MQDRQDGSTTPELLVVEDDELVGRSFASLLTEHARVELVGTLAEAERAMQRGHWAGIVLDLELPDGSGLSLLEDLRARLLTTPVLVVSGLFEREVANRCHALDAHCVFKPNVIDDLLHFGARAAARFQLAESRTSSTVEALRETLRLTPRETDFVRLLARGERHESLTESAGVTRNTTKTMVRRLLEKFGEPSMEAVARTVFEEMLRGELSTRRGGAR